MKYLPSTVILSIFFNGYAFAQSGGDWTDSPTTDGPVVTQPTVATSIPTFCNSTPGIHTIKHACSERAKAKDVVVKTKDIFVRTKLVDMNITSREHKKTSTGFFYHYDNPGKDDSRLWCRGSLPTWSKRQL